MSFRFAHAEGLGTIVIVFIIWAVTAVPTVFAVLRLLNTTSVHAPLMLVLDIFELVAQDEEILTPCEAGLMGINATPSLFQSRFLSGNLIVPCQGPALGLSDEVSLLTIRIVDAVSTKAPLQRPSLLYHLDRRGPRFQTSVYRPVVVLHHRFLIRAVTTCLIIQYARYCLLTVF